MNTHDSLHPMVHQAIDSSVPGSTRPGASILLPGIVRGTDWEIPW